MIKENIKKAIISGYKIIVYGFLLLTFMLVMSRVNFALLLMTRTAVVTAGTFLVIFTIMQYVYGNFEIGFKKSKPVFLTTMISVLIANFMATLAMILMGLVQFKLKAILAPALIHLIITYIIQGIIIWICAHIGNSLYFKLYDPARVMFYQNDDFLYKKISRYVESHDKQYRIVGVDNELNNEELDSKNVDIVFAIGLNRENDTELMKYCYKNRVRLIYNLSSTDILMKQKDTLVIDDVLLGEIVPKEVSLIQLCTKRIIDIIGSLVLLIITLPITIGTSLAIKIDDGGPVFYSQERLTKDGKVFKIYKFRSMKTNSGNRPVEIDDDRITKVGHIIRKLRIDELPQAINILKGDISLVGPRPESKAHAANISKEVPDFNLRLRVKGGLTGYAQIFGKYNTNPEMKLLLDLKYIESQSTLEDLKLILQTLIVFIRPDSTEAFNTDEDEHEENAS